MEKEDSSLLLADLVMVDTTLNNTGHIPLLKRMVTLNLVIHNMDMPVDTRHKPIQVLIIQGMEVMVQDSHMVVRRMGLVDMELIMCLMVMDPMAMDHMAMEAMDHMATEAMGSTMISPAMESLASMEANMEITGGCGNDRVRAVN